ncbi:MAG: hypothetical protein DMF95_00985 [Acidobacteria bacterium]|nr:MAG: hypothetical protein DMF95_00985 [Acidobacteriota bacterium]
MNDLPDYELHRTPSEPSPPTLSPTRPTGLWVAAVLLIAAAGVAAYIAFGWRARPVPTAATPAPTASEKAPPPSLGGKGEPITIPPLDASDALVRTLIRALSENPAVTAWLTTNGLIRNFTVVVANMADGATPAKHLRALRPSSAFRVVERAGSPYVDPRSYDRYAVIADAIASVDPTGAARLYATLKPRIEEAHRELGSSDRSFDRTLERAIIALLDTPILDGPVRLKPKGIGYAYADERLERLTGAQKQFLRMGPRNVRIMKARLREIALTLGIPPIQLPGR